MSRIDGTINTRDGQCPASLFTPAGKTGSWPGVIFFMDGLGIRTTMWNMGQRLADLGYTVLLPDLYYRGGRYEPMVPAQVFADPKQKEVLMQRVGSLDRERKIADAGAFIDFLSTRAEVKGERFGITGYCMGGNVALTVAGAYPDRFAAIAAFHAGGLVTEQPDSPHRFLKGVSGRVYVGGADQDAHFTNEQKDVLEKALNDAGVDHRVEIYAGALHGYAVPDHPVFNTEAAERHWQELSKLLDGTLAR
jgi:carboxymethylenebutenolidase